MPKIDVGNPDGPKSVQIAYENGVENGVPPTGTKNAIISSIPDRYVMVFLCALCTCINYADRVNMSVAIISMAEEYSFTLRQQSIVLSSFFLGYIPMQLAGALLCRRYGGKTVLQHGALMWSLLTIATPFAADAGMIPLLTCRVCMGLAEGVAFPGVFHFLSSWIPSCERGRSIALFLTGAHVGTMAALVVSPIVIRTLSWRFVFFIFGSVGFVWIAAWQVLAYDRDDAVRRRRDGKSRTEQAEEGRGNGSSITKPLTKDSGHGGSDSEADDDNNDGGGGGGGGGDEDGGGGNANRATMTTTHDGSGSGITTASRKWQIFTANEWSVMRTVLTNRRTLSVCGAQSMFALIHFVILSWLPTYFKNVYGTDTGSLSFTFAPYGAMAVAANVGGMMADSLIEKGWGITTVRKLVTVVSCVGAATCLVIFSQMQSVEGGIAAISLSMAFMSLNSGGFESAYLDVASPGCTGLFKAVANTMGSFSGLVAVPFSTLVLEWVGGSWRMMFASLAGWHIALAVVFMGFYSAERVVTDHGR